MEKSTKFEITVNICFPVTVKGIMAKDCPTAKKLAIEAVERFFRDPDVDPMYFDNHFDQAYDAVSMNAEGLEDISISVDSNYSVK